MKHLRVAIAVPTFPNIVQTYILNQLAAFKNMKVDFLIIAEIKRTYKPVPTIISHNKLLNHVIYINPCFSNIIKELLSLPLHSITYWKAIKSIISYRGESYDLVYHFKSLLRARVMINRPFDIMHSHSLFISHHYLFIKDIFSIPIVTTYHGQVPKGVKKLPEKKLLKVLEKVDAFIVNTEFAKKELRQLGCSIQKIHIIPQGTKLDDFPYIKRSIATTDKIKLLTVGRLSLEKGHLVAIKALLELSNELPNVEYHIVGNGPEEENLAQFATNNNLQKKIIFHGFKTGDELKQLFTTSHIFILPSINTGDGYLVETQGVVLQEAQASGLPVIGSQTGGIPDVIINGVTGLIFGENDHNELANLIKKLIDTPSFYQRISESARKDVEDKFDIYKVSQKIIDLYDIVLKKTQ